MKHYSVFTHSHLAPVAVRHGFSWPSFLLGPFWALWVGCWRGVAVYTFIVGVQWAAFPHSASYALHLEKDLASMAMLCHLAGLVGSWAWLSTFMNAWLMKSLLGRGFIEADVVAALDGLHALAVASLVRPIPSRLQFIE